MTEGVVIMGRYSPAGIDQHDRVSGDYGEIFSSRDGSALRKERMNKASEVSQSAARKMT